MPSAVGRIVVGVDGSPEADAALRWAAEEADLRGAELVIAHARVVVAAAPLSDLTFASVRRELVAAAAGLLADARDEVLSRFPDLTVDTSDAEQRPEDLLITWSDDADLVVTGSRGRGRLTAGLLGSVSVRTAAHTHCPAVIVSASRAGAVDRSGPVVAGVGTSPAATQAVAYAATEAALRQAELVLVRTWAMPAWLRQSMLLGERETDRLQAAERDLLDRAVGSVRERHPSLKVTDLLVEADRDTGLLQASRDAALLVIGYHREANRSGLGLGPVALNVLHRSHCPVLLGGPA